LDGYRYIVDAYITPHLGTKLLNKLSAADIDRWYVTLQAQGLSAATIANARRRLHAALEVARKRRLVSENVVGLTDAPRAASSPRVILDEAQIVALLTHLQQTSHRMYPLYALACTTGMRQAELFGLRWPAVDLTAGTLVVREQLHRSHDAEGAPIHVRERSTKSGKERTLFLPPPLVAVLASHRQQQRLEQAAHGERWQGSDLVFTSEDGTPLAASSFVGQFHRLLSQADLPRVAFHSLRHTAGSMMLAHGASLIAVAHVLGHANPSITARIYAHSYEDAQRQALSVAVAALVPSPLPPELPPANSDAVSLAQDTAS
jgi:integrase